MFVNMVQSPKSNNQIHLTVMNFEDIVYEGNVIALSSENEQGVFDILPLHTNFISIIRKKITLYESEGVKKDIPIKTGILKAIENNVSVFLGLEGTQIDLPNT